MNCDEYNPSRDRFEDGLIKQRDEALSKVAALESELAALQARVEEGERLIVDLLHCDTQLCENCQKRGFAYLAKQSPQGATLTPAQGGEGSEQ